MCETVDYNEWFVRESRDICNAASECRYRVINPSVLHERMRDMLYHLHEGYSRDSYAPPSSG
jgi:hypothetical protein